MTAEVTERHKKKAEQLLTVWRPVEKLPPILLDVVSRGLAEIDEASEQETAEWYEPILQQQQARIAELELSLKQMTAKCKIMEDTMRQRGLGWLVPEKISVWLNEKDYPGGSPDEV